MLESLWFENDQNKVSSCMIPCLSLYSSSSTSAICLFSTAEWILCLSDLMAVSLCFNTSPIMALSTFYLSLLKHICWCFFTNCFYFWLTSFFLYIFFWFICYSLLILTSCLANTSCNLLILLIVAIFSFSIIFWSKWFCFCYLTSFLTFKFLSLYFTLSELRSAIFWLFLMNLSFTYFLFESIVAAVYFTFSKLCVIASFKHFYLSAYIILTRSFASYRLKTFWFRILFLLLLFLCSLPAIFYSHSSSIRSSCFFKKSLLSSTCLCLSPFNYPLFNTYSALTW